MSQDGADRVTYGSQSGVLCWPYFGHLFSTIPMPCFGASQQLNTEKAVRCSPQGRPRVPYIYHVSSVSLKSFSDPPITNATPRIRGILLRLQVRYGAPQVVLRSASHRAIQAENFAQLAGLSIFTIATIRAHPAKMRSTSARRTNCAPNTASRRTAR